MPTVRTAAVIAVPALASLLGVMWFRRRSKSTSQISAADIKTELGDVNKDTVVVDVVEAHSDCFISKDVNCVVQSNQYKESHADSITNLVLSEGFSEFNEATVVDEVLSESSSSLLECMPSCSSVSPGTSCCTENSPKMGMLHNMNLDRVCMFYEYLLRFCLQLCRTYLGSFCCLKSTFS